MVVKIKESIRIMLSVIVLFWFSSVAYGQMQPPPAEQIAGSPPVETPTPHIGRVGIVPACFRPEIIFDKPPTTLTAALEGAGFGAVGPVIGGAYLGPGGLVLGVLLSPVGAAVGTVTGVNSGSSPKEIKEAEDTLQGYLATLDFQETMRAHLVSAAREQTRYSFVALDLQGPKIPDEGVIYDVSSHEDIDAVLEFGVSECLLIGKLEDFNPDRQLVVRVDTRFLSVKDGKLYDGPFLHFSSDTPKFTYWSADNGRLFKEELDRGLQSLAEQIIRTFILFMNNSGKE